MMRTPAFRYTMPAALVIALASTAAAPVAAFAQTPPSYNRILSALDVVQTWTGPAIRVAHLLRIAGEESEVRVLDTEVVIRVNGVPVDRSVQELAVPPGATGTCFSNCSQTCGSIGGADGDCSSAGTPTGQCVCDYIYTVSTPQPLEHGDRIEAGVGPARGALPEIDTSDDSMSLTYDAVSVSPRIEGPLLTAVPNPSSASFSIGIQLPAAAHATLSLLDLGGRTIRTLSQGNLLSEGWSSFVWNGRDDRNRRVGSGVYIVSLQVAHRRWSRLIVLLP